VQSCKQYFIFIFVILYIHYRIFSVEAEIIYNIGFVIFILLRFILCAVHEYKLQFDQILCSTV